MGATGGEKWHRRSGEAPPSTGGGGGGTRGGEPEHSADRHGNPGIDVFTTPLLCEWSEEAAVLAVQDQLDPGMITLGTRIDLKHLVATPIGLMVRGTATLKGIDGRER